jgi:hypothetical protein
MHAPTSSPGPKRPLVLVQLNELCLNLVERYAAQQSLPGFSALFRGDVRSSRAELQYEQLEPWIQWYSIYTGKTAAEHGVFRLGDAVEDRSTQLSKRTA